MSVLISPGRPCGNTKREDINMVMNETNPISKAPEVKRVMWQKVHQDSGDNRGH